MFLRRNFPKILQRNGSDESNDGGGSGGSINSKSMSYSNNQYNNEKKVGSRRGSSEHSQQQQQQQDVNHIDKSLLQGRDGLAQFDACVEACDALAASGGHTVHSNGIMNKHNNNDGRYALNDCSIMVSPDGALLFLPRGDETAGSLRSGCHQEKDHSPNEASVLSGSDLVPSTPQTTTTTTTTPSSNNNLNQASKSDPSHTQFFAGEDYGSAVVVGNDLTVGGDLRANGFAAKGWNPERTTESLHVVQTTMESTLTFMEELALSRKNCANVTSQACDRLRDVIVLEECPEHQAVYAAQRNVLSSPRDSPQKQKQKQQPPKPDVTDDLLDKVSKALESFDSGVAAKQKSRLGPLQFPGSTLHAASIAVEQYHSMIAEGDAHRWRLASSGIQNRNIKMGEIYEGRHEGLLPELRVAIANLSQRSQRRESAFNAARDRAKHAEKILLDRKEKAQMLWEKVKQMEEQVQIQIEEQVRERSRAREQKRRKEQNERQALIAAGKLDSTVTQQEIWELVSQVSENMDGMSFAPTGLPTPSSVGPIDKTLEIPKSPPLSPSKGALNTFHDAPKSPGQIRDDFEHEMGLPDFRKQAMDADDDVDDAACALLNVLSAYDTTKRSARIAAESCLLSAANSHARCLRSMLELEKASIRERLDLIQDLEKTIEKIDVRSDLEKFIQHEKKHIPDGKTRLGEDDDGGIASALAALNSHSEGIGLGVSVLSTSFSGWNNNGSSNSSIHRDDIEESVEILFETNPYLEDKNLNTNMKEEDFQAKAREARAIVHGAVKLLVRAVQKMNAEGRSHRASVCYALNNQRGVKTYIDSQVQFDGLCTVFDALLTNCDREAADIASAKMCMMLSQTFYQAIDTEKNEDDSYDREGRIYPKTKLVNHPIWSDEDFWVQALFQCVTESITQSGVMTGFEKEILCGSNTGGVRKRKVKWYDLSPDERLEAASQVHAVIFAQLGALAHSMVEFGCDLETACAFVRRLSIRHQLPLSHRSMLLKHLMERHVVVNGENQSKLEKRITNTIDSPNENGIPSKKVEFSPTNLELDNPLLDETTLEPTSPPMNVTFGKMSNVSHDDVLELSIPALADAEERDDSSDSSTVSQSNPASDVKETTPVSVV